MVIDGADRCTRRESLSRSCVPEFMGEQCRHNRDSSGDAIARATETLIARGSVTAGFVSDDVRLLAAGRGVLFMPAGTAAVTQVTGGRAAT